MVFSNQRRFNPLKYIILEKAKPYTRTPRAVAKEWLTDRIKEFEKSKGKFRLARMKMGEEESKRKKKEGEWTPSRERLREMALRRKEEQESPEF